MSAGRGASEPAVNGDLTQRAEADTAAMAWAPSPSGSVWRKRVHRVGPAESGQVTSLVRYQPEARFPGHDHPGGEEILVLEGIFSDEHGDWPAGTYLLNPEGFRHSPFSRSGCLLFVKLRQYPGRARQHLALDTDAMAWQPSQRPGISCKTLYAQAGFGDTVRLERWDPGAGGAPVRYPSGAELLVLEGAYADEFGRHGAGSWVRMPAGSGHVPRTGGGCTWYLKTGGLAYLESAPAR